MYVYVCLYEHAWTTCMQETVETRTSSEPLELKLQVAMNYYVDANT